MKQIHSIVWKEDKWYVARALEVEVVSQGKTEKEALNNLKEALELFFEDNKKDDIATVKEPKLQEIPISFHA